MELALAEAKEVAAVTTKTVAPTKAATPTTGAPSTHLRNHPGLHRFGTSARLAKNARVVSTTPIVKQAPPASTWPEVASSSPTTLQPPLLSPRSSTKITQSESGATVDVVEVRAEVDEATVVVAVVVPPRTRINRTLGRTRSPLEAAQPRLNIALRRIRRQEQQRRSATKTLWPQLGGTTASMMVRCRPTRTMTNNFGLIHNGTKSREGRVSTRIKIATTT